MARGTKGLIAMQRVAHRHSQEMHELRAEIERLRAALREILMDGPIWRAQRIAREALANQQADNK